MKEVLARRGEHPGLVAILSAIKLCSSYKPWHDKQAGKTFLKPDSGSFSYALPALLACRPVLLGAGTDRRPRLAALTAVGWLTLLLLLFSMGGAAMSSRTRDCIQIGIAGRPSFRSSRIAEPLSGSLRTRLRRTMIPSRSEGSRSFSQCKACTTRIAGRPAQ